MAAMEKMQGKIELIAKVVEKAKVVDGNGCLIRVGVQGECEGSCDFYDIILKDVNIG